MANMSLVCPKCDHVSYDNPSYSEATTRYWMDIYYDLKDTRQMENKKNKRKIEEMSKHYSEEIKKLEEYIYDLEKTVLYYRKLELERKGDIYDNN